MKMRADLRQLRHIFHKCLVDRTRLQGTQPDSADSFHLMHGPDQGGKVFSLSQILPVGAEVNAGENDLLHATGHKTFCLLHDIRDFPAADPASCIGNNAVGTELIAAVLHLQKCPGVSFRPVCFQLFYFSVFSDFRGICPPAAPCEIPFQLLHQIALSVTPDNQVYGRILLQLLSPHLGITTHGNDNRIRIHAARLVKHLAGFPVRNICHRAGIDHIDIRSRLERNNTVTGVLQRLLHGLQLIRIHLASQIVKCRFS